MASSFDDPNAEPFYLLFKKHGIIATNIHLKSGFWLFNVGQLTMCIKDDAPDVIVLNTLKDMTKHHEQLKFMKDINARP